MSHPLDRLRYHVSGAIERGEKDAIVEQPVKGNKIMTHTPGPWNIGKYPINDYAYAVYGKDNSKIAQLEKFDQQYQEEEEANANLIAAAPELLEALSDLENYSELVLSEIDSSQSGWYYQFQAAIQKARKALTLAKEGV